MLEKTFGLFRQEKPTVSQRICKKGGETVGEDSKNILNVDF